MQAEHAPLPLRILADDLTGALDCAAMLCGTADIPVQLESPTGDAAVAAVATATRDISPARLPAALARPGAWLAEAGLAFKKIDSLLRGNSFAELAWLLQTQPSRFRKAIWVPAFPAQGRFTAQGRHWVSPPHQPGTPGSWRFAAPLAEAFARVGLRARCGGTLQALLQDDGAQVLVPDVLSDRDLAAVATASRQPASRDWLWAGSAGLAGALAHELGLAPGLARMHALGPVAGPVLLASCSRHAVLRAQMAALLGAHPEWGTDTAQSTPGHRIRDLAPRQTLPADIALAQLQRSADLLVATCSRPAALVVVGGDTLLALCRASGAQALHAGACDRSGWGYARLAGGRWDGLPCYSRSGAFGAPDDLLALMRTLTHADHRHSPDTALHKELLP